MFERSTALLLHTTRFGSHYDWLIEDPQWRDDSPAPLWTARLAPPTAQWRALRRWLLIPLEPHRRAYLDYQGPVSGGRGSVQRVDIGRVGIELWTPSRRVVTVRMTQFAGRVEMRILAPDRWEAAVVSPES